MSQENKYITGDESAYPTLKQILGTGEDYHEIPGRPGLTIRQYYAGLAMQGIIARVENKKFKEDEYNGTYSSMATIAEHSVDLADALIEELNKK